jgi:hypothetical protein
MVKQGSYRLKPRAYLSDKNNGAGDGISTLILDGTVKVNANNDIPMSFTGTMMDPNSINDFAWIAPYLTLDYNDQELGLVSQTEQQGLFIVMPPGETHTSVDGTGSIVAYDPCWILKQNTIPNALNFTTGQNIVTSIKSVITGAGFAANRVSIPAKGNNFGKDRSFDPGTPRLDIINELLMLVGYYPLATDRFGIFNSRGFRTLQKEEPIHKISSALGDVVDTVTLDPDPERLCNRCSVSKNDAAGDPVWYTKDNTRLDSPVSIPNMDGVVFGKKIEASNVDTLEEAKALVQKTLEEGASYVKRITVATLPFLEWDIRDVVHLVIFSDSGLEIASDRWWVDSLEVNFVPNARPMVWTCNKLFKFDPEDV